MDLSECGLSQIPRGLPSSIRYLQLRKNNLTTIERRSFRDCPDVNILVLDENQLSSIDDRAFEAMPSLMQLWLNGNQLTSIPHPLPQTLKRLLLDQNAISQLENVFPEQSQLTKLSLMGNNLSYVAYDALVNLHHLESLDLSENRIRHIYGNTFSHLKNLTTLQLSKNPLSHLHGRAFWGLQSLDTLKLAYIQAHVAVHHDVFQQLSKLKTLNLDSSPLLVQTLLSHGRGFSESFHSVEDLSLVSCELTHLDPEFLDWFQNLKWLHISSTRWHCDKSLLWFRDFLRSGRVNITNVEGIVCATPRLTHGRTIASLTDTEFVPTTQPPKTTSTTSKPLTTFLPHQKARSSKKTITVPSSVATHPLSSTSTEKVSCISVAHLFLCFV